MPKISPGELRAFLAAEKADALSAMSASKLSEERAAALDYYLGDMSRDMPAPEGRSRAVSTDVSDTVEGLMPSLMDIFTAGDEVVRFEPVGPEDVQGAEQETDYVNHVFMQQNPGFLVLYSFIKDALLSKVGVVKVWWETREEHERETYLDQPADAFALIVADPAVEVIAHSEHSISRHQGVDEQHQPAKRQGVTASAREDGRLRPDVFAGDAVSALCLRGLWTGVNLRSFTTSRCKRSEAMNAPGSRACRPRSSASLATLAAFAIRTIASTTCSGPRPS